VHDGAQFTGASPNLKFASGMLEMGEANSKLRQANLKCGGWNFGLASASFEFGESLLDSVASQIKRHRSEFEFA
jgi:hypothetical protein